MFRIIIQFIEHMIYLPSRYVHLGVQSNRGATFRTGRYERIRHPGYSEKYYTRYVYITV